MTLTTRLQFGGTVSWRVDVALAPDLAGTSGLWDTARWDQSQWVQTDPLWVDVSSDVITVGTSRGRERWLDRVPPGTASVTLDNSTGRYNPLGGADLLGTVRLRPGRWLRVSARVDGVTPPSTWWPVFVGIVTDLDDRYTAGGYDATMTLHAVDMLTRLTVQQEPELSTPRPSEQARDRAAHILDTADAWRYNIVGLTGPVRATTFPADRLEELNTAVTTSWSGLVFCDRSGTIQCLAVTHYADTVAAGFSWVASPGVTGDVAVLDVDAEWSLINVVNDVRLSNRDGSLSEVRLQDSESQTLYGQRTYVNAGHDNTSTGHITTQAQRILDAHRLDRIQIVGAELAATSDTGAENLIRMELFDYVAVPVNVRGAPGAPGAWDWWTPTHIQSIAHRVTADDWTVTVRLDDAALAGDPPTLGTPAVSMPYQLVRAATDPASGHVTVSGVPDDRLAISRFDADGVDRSSSLDTAGNTRPWVTVEAANLGPEYGFTAYLVTDVTVVGDVYQMQVDWLASAPGIVGSGSDVTVRLYFAYPIT